MYLLRILSILLPILLCLTLSSNADDSACLNRCDRLLTRTLQRIDYTPRKVEKLFRSNQRIKNLGDICWKFYDFNDCQMQCDRRPKRDLTNFEELSKMVVKRCKFVDAESSQNIRCIHKYHSFMEVRCSSYLGEAVKLKKKVKGKKDVRTQETCRFLHYHHTCLANTVFFYCPSAKKHFNKFTLRDYFLSFIVPDNDEAFPDDFLDYCQVFDFAKQAKDVYDTTSSLKQEDFFDGITQAVKPSTEFPIVKLLGSEDGRDGDQKPKKLFSSTESLEDTPPNFFYSSARIETTTHHSIIDNTKAGKTLKDPFPHSGESTAYTTSRFWNVEPVSIEFVSHPVSDESSTTPGSSEVHDFTINPNDLVSTIFRIPNIFPTDVISPDPVTETDLDVGKEVSLDESEVGDGSVEWKGKKPIGVVKNVETGPHKVGNSSEESDDVHIVNLLDDGPKETQLTLPTSGEMFTESVNLTSSETENATDSAVDKYNNALNTSSEDVIFPEHVKPISTKIDHKSIEKPNETNKAPVKSQNPQTKPKTYELDNKDHGISNAVIQVDPLPAETPNQAKPLLHGTKVHVKRIRHYSEPGDGKGDTIKKGNSGAIYFSDAQAKATLQYQTSFATTIPALLAPQIETARGGTFSGLPETDPEEINWETLQSIKWFIIGYGLLFLITFSIVVYLILSLILKKCQKRRSKQPTYAYQY
uniref:Chondroitin proteoglycan 4 domain-containing protein n=1 Tax=Panagrellus redivivus TaxID=6233 RepID=A0A7E4VPI7_PANRE